MANNYELDIRRVVFAIIVSIVIFAVGIFIFQNLLAEYSRLGRLKTFKESIVL